MYMHASLKLHYIQILHMYIGELLGSGGSGGFFLEDDEDGCTAGMFLCGRSRRCILMTQLCDGVNDCGNQEDESVSMCGM